MTAPVDATTDADRVAAAVTRCRTVAGLSRGGPGGVATYLPGRTVPGVAIREYTPVPEVEVRVVGRYGPTMAEISREVDAAVRSVLPRHRVLIGIDDLDTTGAADPDPAGTAPGRTGQIR